MTPTPALHYELIRVLEAERIDRAQRHRPAVQASLGRPRGVLAALRRRLGGTRDDHRRRPDLVGAGGCRASC